MMNLACALISFACALGAAALPGCALSVEPIDGVPPPVGVPSRDGEVTVNWLVAGDSAPVMCARYGAVAMALVVYAASGRPVLHQSAPCGTFTITVSLPEGTYSADATLLDARGRKLSTTRTIDAIEVVAGTNLAINLDFPADSLR